MLSLLSLLLLLQAAVTPAQPASSIAAIEANDLIYQLDASRTYDPWPRLDRITAPTTWINSADGFINPRNLVYPSGRSPG